MRTCFLRSGWLPGDHRPRQAVTGRFKKNVIFQAPANLVHKKCGQGVENHVNKTNLKPLYNDFSHMPKK